MAMQYKKIMLSVITSCLTLTLSACGGGSDSATPTSPTTPTIPTPTNPKDHSGLAPLTATTIQPNEHLAGGDVTMFVKTKDAFSQRPVPVSDDFRSDGFFTSGDHLFRTPHKGIGPLVNAASCQGCHHNDGKGILPESINEPMTSIFLKIGDIYGNEDPIYGDQIQTYAEQSLTTSDVKSGLPQHNGSINGDKLFGEAYAYIEYEKILGQYPDGTNYELRKPTYKVKDLSYGPFNDKVAFSARVAPAIFGSGLLEAIPAQNILALADPLDKDKDGISGKAAMVTNVMTKKVELGRFAYKAQNPIVLQQISGAYRGDMGITNKLFIEESCTKQQTACTLGAEKEIKQGNEPDIVDRQLALVEFYNKVLAVPARRGYDRSTKEWQSEIIAGCEQFFNTGCVDCHTPRHVTGTAMGSLLGKLTLTELLPDPKPLAYLSNQVIYPYTDLLLHDMGGSCKVTRELADGTLCSAGELCIYVQRCEGLADDLPQGNATGTEWKTPPLWGTGLVQTVHPKATFMHDGRARTHEEAILWHGGESEASKDKFMALTAVQRQQLLAFLGSL